MREFDDFQRLSKRAQLLFRLLFGPWLFYAIYSAWSFTGPVRWLSEYEASINSGHFHPYFTFGTVLVLPGAAIMALAHFYDRVKKQGIYTSKKSL